MFLSKIFKHTRAKVMGVLACFTMLLGVGAAIGAGVSAQDNEVVETKASVTDGKYRINVLTNSANWLQDNVNTVFNPAGSNVAMSRDTDFTQSSTNTSYSTVTIGNTTYNWQTYELSAKTGVTKNENYWFGRGNASSNYNWFDSGINLYTQFRSNNWDNTIVISGTWDNFSASAYGWYVKVELHTGKTLGTTSYEFMNSAGTPSNENTPSGYSFAGWYKDSGFNTKWTSGSQYTDQKLYAKYTPNTYAATISAGTGVQSVYLSTNSSATSGSASGTKFNMDATVYGFAELKGGYQAPAGWTLVSGTANTAGAIYRVTSKTVTTSGASFGSIAATAQTYTITAALDGGEGASNKSYSTSTSSQSKLLDTPTKSGYTFAGYEVTSGPASGSASISSLTTLNLTANTYGAITVTATWTQESFTLIFDGNGGTGIAPADAIVAVGASYTMPSNPFTKTGHTFGGWNTAEDGTGDNYSDGTSYELDYEDGDEITLYAKWSPSVYTVTLNTHGGTINAGNVTSYTYGTGATLPTNVTKAGYNFKGWFTSAEGGTKVTAISSSETGAKTFHAQWEEYTDFWISFDGGTTKLALTSVSATTGDELYQLSTTSTLTVFGGDSITFWRGATAGTAIAFTYASNGLTAETTGGDNNVVTTDNTWRVRNYATSANIYLKIFSSASAYKFYLGGKTGTISSTTNGVSSGSTFYVQDLMKKNGESSNFGTDGAKIGVYFFNPVDELNSVASWASAFCTKLSTVDNVDLYSVTVPQFSGHSMKWGSVEVLRFPSGTTVGNMDFSHAYKDGSNHYNGVKINSFSSDIQNGVQITHWSGGTSGDAMYPCAGNAFMYTDGGLASGKGVYIDVTTAPAGSWKLTDGYGIYCYFFSIVNGSGAAEAWSAKATLVPGETKIYECEVPQYSSADVEWAKLIVVNNNTPAFVEGLNQYQTQDLWYNATMRSYQHITFTGSLTGEYKAEAASNSSYTDATRAESWGTRFNASITCDGDGGNDADSTKWGTAKSEFDAAPLAARNLIKNSTASSSGTQLQKAVSKYDDIIYKYGTDAGVVSKTYSDFISRRGTPNYSGGSGYAAIIPSIPKEQSPLTLALWIVLGCGLAGLGAIGTAYFVSKKKKRPTA